MCPVLNIININFENSNKIYILFPPPPPPTISNSTKQVVIYNSDTKYKTGCMLKYTSSGDTKSSNRYLRQ